ncbi:MAG: hypothetical protein CMG09_05910 [Candidatus Marinimicrobia bacterium]|nr:hypothetical protein [Candidatus Neomarinimicrobiota bacterium]|tara:strand:- start:1699 stop:2520 length:822 start_codon:yes stop_codon:yes gene_type:complete
MKKIIIIFFLSFIFSEIKLSVDVIGATEFSHNLGNEISGWDGWYYTKPRINLAYERPLFSDNYNKSSLFIGLEHSFIQGNEDDYNFIFEQSFNSVYFLIKPNNLYLKLGKTWWDFKNSTGPYSSAISDIKGNYNYGFGWQSSNPDSNINWFVDWTFHNGEEIPMNREVTFDKISFGLVFDFNPHSSTKNTDSSKRINNWNSSNKNKKINIDLTILQNKKRIYNELINIRETNDCFPCYDMLISKYNISKEEIKNIVAELLNVCGNWCEDIDGK